MKNIITLLDPDTYGLNRTAVALGLCALTVAVLVCSKLLDVLHAAQQVAQ